MLLVNLLIAMMNATYTTYSETAEREFMYNRCFDLMESQVGPGAPALLTLTLQPHPRGSGALC